jgi:Asp-tRNA(Asn)/Glu-tRNA(Gln) amidotransferase C subunit
LDYVDGLSKKSAKTLNTNSNFPLKVSFSSFFRNAVKVLEDSIEFASRIHNIETTEDIKPLYTVLEDFQLQLREDKISDGNIKQDVMRNAMKIEEETYFITPK